MIEHAKGGEDEEYFFQEIAFGILLGLLQLLHPRKDCRGFIGKKEGNSAAFTIPAEDIGCLKKKEESL